MNTDELEKKLSKSLDTFSMEMQNRYEGMEKVTPEDFDYLARYTFYTMTDFKESIIKYLKENK